MQIDFFSLIKTISREYHDFQKSKKSMNAYYDITQVKVKLSIRKKKLNIQKPGELLSRPIFLVTDNHGYYISNWNVRDLCSTKPIKMGIKLICDMYNVDVPNLDYENPPGPDVSLTLSEVRIMHLITFNIICYISYRIIHIIIYMIGIFVR